MNLLIEQYRPSTREEIVGNKEELDKIFDLVKSGNLPHMIFEGRAGVGKTSTAIVIAKQLFGEFYKSNFLELNASDERGINIVRNQIKTFAKSAPFNAQFKILLLDEADNMTSDAQQALRRTMEKYSEVTKFIFSVNHLEKLIDPIQSRCEVFRFGPIPPKDMVARLFHIYMTEKGNPGSNPNIALALEKISEISNGDMRRAINHLQLVLSSEKPVSKELVTKEKPTDFGEVIFKSISVGRFLEARKSLQTALELGYTERYLIELIHKTYISESLEYKIKAEAIFALCNADIQIVDGVHQILVMDNLLFKLMELHK